MSAKSVRNYMLMIKHYQITYQRINSSLHLKSKVNANQKQQDFFVYVQAAEETHSW